MTIHSRCICFSWTTDKNGNIYLWYINWKSIFDGSFVNQRIKAFGLFYEL
jgi:hypothetical protein